MSTIIIKVDLECWKCYKKIKSVLCDLQVRWQIETITYDQKGGKVIICGPFDADELAKKLRCRACKVIIGEIEIKKPEPPKPPEEKKPDPPPAEEKKPDPPPAEEKKPDPPPAEEKKPDPPPAEEKKPDPPKEEKKPDPAPTEEKKPDPAPPQPVYQQLWMYGPPGPVCCCSYHGMCRCCSCGRSAGGGCGSGGAGPGWSSGPGWGSGGYGAPYARECKTYELVSEQDGSCSIM